MFVEKTVNSVKEEYVIVTINQLIKLLTFPFCKYKNVTKVSTFLEIDLFSFQFLSQKIFNFVEVI